MRRARRAEQYTVFVGDGVSDHRPAEVADEVFAKPGLARWCGRRGIPCHEIRAFADVLASLRRRVPKA